MGVVSSLLRRHIAAIVATTLVMLATLALLLMGTSPLVSSPSTNKEHVMRALEDVERSSKNQSTVDSINAIHSDNMAWNVYYADLWCGTPTKQRQTVLVDTGSAITAFPCSSYNEKISGMGLLPKSHSKRDVYLENISETFEVIDCQHCWKSQGSWEKSECQSDVGTCKSTMSYMDFSSWWGTQSRDVCYLGGLHDDSDKIDRQRSVIDPLDPQLASSLAFPLEFACQTGVRGIFNDPTKRTANGILGMNAADDSFWNQMHKAGKLRHRAFSLCTRGTGSLTLGGTDSRFHETPMVYAQMEITPYSNLFATKVRAIYLVDNNNINNSQNVSNSQINNKPWGESIGCTISQLNQKRVHKVNVSPEQFEKYQVIVDSGQSASKLHKDLQDPFLSVWQNLAGREYPKKKHPIDLEDLDHFPTIVFQLHGAQNNNVNYGKEHKERLAGKWDPDHPNDVLVVLPPSRYMHYFFGLGLYDPALWTYSDRMFIGGPHLQQHEVLFDVENKRLGWAESKCDYRGLLKSNGYLPDDSKRKQEEGIPVAFGAGLVLLMSGIGLLLSSLHNKGHQKQSGVGGSPSYEEVAIVELEMT